MVYNGKRVCVMKKSLFVLSIVVVLAALIACLPMGYALADGDSVDVGWYLSQHQSDYVGVAAYTFGAQSAQAYASGYADREHLGVVDAQETVFDWGELSELLVWYSLDKLAQQGQVDLGVKVSTYVKGIQTSKGEPTIADLIAHKAGFADVAADLYAQSADDLKALMVTAKNAPAQVYEPGTVSAYSAYDATLAAYIVEVVSGVSYETYVRTNVLDPLGLTHTAVGAALWDDATVHVARNLTMVYDADGKSIGASRLLTNYYPALSAAGSAEDLCKLARAILAGNLSRKGLYENGNKALRLSRGKSSQAAIALDFAGGKGIVILTNSPSSDVAVKLLAPQYSLIKAPKGVYRLADKVDQSGPFGWLNLLQLCYLTDKDTVLCLSVGEDGSLLTADGLLQPVPLYELVLSGVVFGLAALALVYALVVLVLNLIAAIVRIGKPKEDYPVRLQQWQTSAAGNLLLIAALAVYTLFALRLGDYSSVGMLWKSWVLFGLSVVGLAHVIVLPFVARKQACSKKRIGLYCVTAFALVIVIAALLLAGCFPFI